MVRSQETVSGKKKKSDRAGRLSDDHIVMSDSQRTKETTTTKTAKRKGWTGDEELEWAEPISEEAKL